MNEHLDLDEIDRRILDLLQDDARRTIANIAELVNLSAAPVKRRIDRLEQLGVIVGYTAVLDHAKLGAASEAFGEVRITGQADVDAIIASVSELPEVRDIFTTAGDPDALVRIRVDDVDHLKRVVNALRRSPNLIGTKSLIVLGRWSRATPRGDRPAAAAGAAAISR